MFYPLSLSLALSAHAGLTTTPSYGDLLSSDVADRKVYKAEDPAHYGWEALLRADGEWLV